MSLRRKSVRFVRDVVGTSVVLGAGGAVLGSMNNPAATSAGQALNTYGSVLPVYGSIAGAGLVLGGVRSLSPSKRRKSRRNKRR